VNSEYNFVSNIRYFNRLERYGFDFLLSAVVTELGCQIHGIGCENSQAEAGNEEQVQLKQGFVHVPQISSSIFGVLDIFRILP